MTILSQMSMVCGVVLRTDPVVCDKHLHGQAMADSSARCSCKMDTVRWI